VQLFVVGDIHVQEEKFWTILEEAGLVDAEHRPTPLLESEETRLVLLGDLVHAKSRERYAALAGVERYDEYSPEHLVRVESAQEAFLFRVKALVDSLPEGKVAILMGNHDYNAITPEQGPLRTEDIVHLEWKEGYGGGLHPELAGWILSWPHELIIAGIHLAHVGPLPEHNRYDAGFYIENRRRWIYEERDLLAETSYRLGIYGHTPVRGGVNIASQGRAILLDTNGHGNEYCYLKIMIGDHSYRLEMKGLFFDERINR
jgi:hypothetical protein